MLARKPKWTPPPPSVHKPLARLPNYAGSLVAAVPKDVILRSEPYRRWVASLPCMACGIEGWSQAAHVNHGKAMAMKACDSRLFPLCATRPGHMGHHVEHDLCIGMTREQRRVLEVLYAANTTQRAADAGWCLETLTRKK